MRKFLCSLAIAAAAIACVGATAQTTATPTTPATVTNVYMGGLSYNPGASPAVAGTAIYAHEVNDSGTYAFTVVDALPNTGKPFSINTQFGVGIAQRVATIADVPIYGQTSAGIAYTGTNTGWAYTGGMLAMFKLKPYKDGFFFVAPTARFVKASVGSSGFQPIGGVEFGWGK